MKESLISIQATSMTIVEYNNDVEIILGHEVSIKVPEASSIVPTQKGVDVLVLHYEDDIIKDV